jgi:hypothetical protein
LYPYYYSYESYEKDSPHPEHPYSIETEEQQSNEWTQRPSQNTHSTKES